jgi:hypothetical protein
MSWTNQTDPIKFRILSEFRKSGPNNKCQETFCYATFLSQEKTVLLVGGDVDGGGGVAFGALWQQAAVVQSFCTHCCHSVSWQSLYKAF